MEQTVTNLPVFQIGDHLYNRKYNLASVVRYINTIFSDDIEEKYHRMYDVECDESDYWLAPDCEKITEQEFLFYKLKLGDARR
jgi:hypothetical protein